MLSTTRTAVERNSLCQFWKDSNHNRGSQRYWAMVRGISPCIRASAAAPAALFFQWRKKEAADNMRNLMPSERAYNPRKKTPYLRLFGGPGITAVLARSHSPWRPHGYLESARPLLNG